MASGSARTLMVVVNARTTGGSDPARHGRELSLGFGMVVQETGWGTDVDEGFWTTVEDVVGAEVVDEDYRGPGRCGAALVAFGRRTSRRGAGARGRRGTGGTVPSASDSTASRPSSCGTGSGSASSRGRRPGDPAHARSARSAPSLRWSRTGAHRASPRSHQAVNGLGSGHTIGSAASGSHASYAAPATVAGGAGRGAPRPKGAARLRSAGRSDRGVSSSRTGDSFAASSIATRRAFAPSGPPHPR